MAITKFEVGKWYRWNGIYIRPLYWDQAGGMDWMLDGKPHRCRKVVGINMAAFYDDPSSWMWTWHHLENFEEVTCMNDMHYSKFETGKWYKWVGPTDKTFHNWNPLMNFIFDGKPHKITSIHKELIKFDDKNYYYWDHVKDYLMECVSPDKMLFSERMGIKQQDDGIFFKEGWYYRLKNGIEFLSYWDQDMKDIFTKNVHAVDGWVKCTGINSLAGKPSPRFEDSPSTFQWVDKLENAHKIFDRMSPEEYLVMTHSKLCSYYPMTFDPYSKTMHDVFDSIQGTPRIGTHTKPKSVADLVYSSIQSYVPKLKPKFYVKERRFIRLGTDDDVSFKTKKFNRRNTNG